MDSEALRAKMRARLPRPVEARRWYEIQNATGDVATIRLYDEISWFGITAEDFARELDAVTAPRIEVQINSPGGDVFDGIAIFNALRSHPAHVTTRVDGLAASAASVIVQAGDHRVMLSGTQMAIHDAWGVSVGNAQDMRDFADVLDQVSSSLASIYAQRANGDAEKFRDLMRVETWLNPGGAVEAGLADEVVDPQPRDSDAASNTLTIDGVRAWFRAERDAHPISDPPPGSEHTDSDEESFLRAVLAHTQGENP